MDPISTTLEAASRPPAITETPDNAQLDKDAFLKLLVAQLKYQDPTAPTDVSEMMNQTSALSMVERLDQIAVGIEQMAGSTPLSSASTMLGREITFDIGIGEMTETVDSVRLADGAVLLSAGGFEVPLTSLIEVATVAASASTTSSGSTSPDTTGSPTTSSPTTSSDPAGSATSSGDADTESGGATSDSDAGGDPHHDTTDY